MDRQSAWQSAYVGFETREQEVRKFLRRLRIIGAGRWPRDLQVVELFCGQGGGIEALERMGFVGVEGVELSLSLARRYTGRSSVYAGDCRRLPFADASRDVALVQGGLHHLERLPDDLERTLSEARRILRPGGRFVVVEPWLTPFLRIVHRATAMAALRRVFGKLDALAVMIDNERETYDAWLSQPGMIRSLLDRHFECEWASIRFGKLIWKGRRRA